MIKAVIDTNVIVSAHLTPASKAEQILYLAEAGKIEIYLSPQILDELEATLLSPKLMKLHRDTPEQVRNSIRLLKKYIKITPGMLEVDVITNDPDDNKILACAIEGQVDYIISGDHHLTDLKSFQGIPIVSPDMFLKKLIIH